MAGGFVVQPGTSLGPFNSQGAWTVGSGTGVVDPTGILLSTTAGGIAYATKTVTGTFTNTGYGKVTVNIPDSATLVNIDSIEIFISSVSNFAKYFHFTLFVQTRLHEGSNEILISPTAWTNTGSESWANPMTTLRVRVNALPGLAAAIRFDDILLGYRARPKCIFDFDDGRVTTYTEGYPYLRKYGFKGVSYVNSSFVGKAGFMTLAQINEIHDYGWDVSNHSYDHPHMDQISSDQVAYEIDSTTAWLKTNGFTRYNEHMHFCYPYGDYNQSVVDAVAARNQLTARSTIANRTQAHSLDNQYLLLWQGPPAVSNLAQAMSYVDRTIQDGGVIMWGFHEIVPSPVQSYEWDTASFEGLVDYIASKRDQMDVITLTEWYRGLSQNRRLA